MGSQAFHPNSTCGVGEVKINIVCQGYKGDRILPRLARLLAKETGWSLSDKYDNDSSINYAFPYLELRNINCNFIGLFTHREDTVPDKVKIWYNQAKRALVRLTFAKIYLEELKKYGKSFTVTPPLDRQKFAPCIDDRIIPRKPVIGISGFTYAGGRKGEQLLKAIIKSPIFNKFDIVASGSGWPIKTVRYNWERMQEFYQGLDIYLCTSLIEGVPYPPLEAMACGVRCIIPRGVGLLDELPDMPDLIRYDNKDLKDLENAIELALTNLGKVDRQALREATERFSTKRWIYNHLKVQDYLKENYEKKRKIISIKKDRLEEDYGIGVVAYGKPALDCASRLIKSIRDFMPNCPVALISNKSLGPEDYFVKYPDLDIGGRTAKTNIINLIPEHWKYGLYLDADIEIIADISFIFKALESGWDMVTTKDVDLFHTAERYLSRFTNEKILSLPIVKTDKVLSLAGGVIGFNKNDKVKNLFNNWYIEWKKLAHKDQGALLRAYFKSPVKLLVLGIEWNSFDKYFARKSSAGIIHHAGAPARRWGKNSERNFNLITNTFIPEIKIDDKDLDSVFLCNAMKTFASGNKIVRRGGEFKAKGKIINVLIGYRLAIPINILAGETMKEDILILKEAIR